MRGLYQAEARRPASPQTLEEAQPKISAYDVTVRYGGKPAISNVSLDIPARQVMALIGPSGCGKSTFLRCINRMNDIIDNAVVEGRIEIDGENIYDPRLDVVQLRKRVGMVSQKPNPFPKSVYENVAYAREFTVSRPRVLSLTRWSKAA